MGRARAKIGWDNGTFRELPNGNFQYRFYYYNEYRQPRRKSFSGSKSDCIDKARKFCEKNETVKKGLSPDASICEILINKYKTDYEKNYLAEAGYGRNIENLKKVKKHIIGNVPIREVQSYDIEAFYATLSNYSNSVIEKTCGQMKLAFKIAKRERIIDENPYERYELRKPRSRKKTRKVYALTEEEQRRFVEAIKNHKSPYGRNSYKHQLLIELYTGMRMGEINALRPCDVDFKNNIIRIRGTISKGIGCRQVLNDFTKTEAGMRDVPMNALAREVLKDAIAVMKDNPEGLIFYDRNKGSVISTSEVCNFYRRICLNNGITYYGQHALRHTFATRCIEANVPAVVLKTWLGHTDIHITLDTYSDVYSRLNNSAMDKFESYVEDVMSAKESSL